MARLDIPRCPGCNSGTIRKREMLVKSGNYSRVGLSTGLSGNSSTRIFASRGRNDMVDSLMPMSYLWPSILAVFLFAYIADSSTPIGLEKFVAVVALLVNILWFLAVHDDHDKFTKEWFCTKCGHKWLPKEIADDQSEKEDARVLVSSKDQHSSQPPAVDSDSKNTFPDGTPTGAVDDINSLGISSEEFQRIHHFGNNARLNDFIRYCEKLGHSFNNGSNNHIVALRLHAMRKNIQQGLSRQVAIARAIEEYPLIRR